MLGVAVGEFVGARVGEFVGDRVGDCVGAACVLYSYSGHVHHESHNLLKQISACSHG